MIPKKKTFDNLSEHPLFKQQICKSFESIDDILNYKTTQSTTKNSNSNNNNNTNTNKINYTTANYTRGFTNADGDTSGSKLAANSYSVFHDTRHKNRSEINLNQTGLGLDYGNLNVDLNGKKLKDSSKQVNFKLASNASKYKEPSHLIKLNTTSMNDVRVNAHGHEHVQRADLVNNVPVIDVYNLKKFHSKQELSRNELDDYLMPTLLSSSSVKKPPVQNLGYLMPSNNNSNNNVHARSVVELNKSTYEDDCESEQIPKFPNPMANGDLIRSRTDFNLQQSIRSCENLSPSAFRINGDSKSLQRYANITSDQPTNCKNQIDEKRLQLLNDLINNLEDYLIFLEIVIEEYYPNLNNKQKLFATHVRNDLEKIFQYVIEFNEFLSLTFLPELKAKQESWNQSQANVEKAQDAKQPNATKTIVDTIVKHIVIIKSYDNYINKLESFLKHFDYSIFQSKIQFFIDDLDKKVQSKYSKVVSQMKIDHPKSNLSLKSLLIYIQAFPDIINKFLIAYEIFISVEDEDEFKLFNQVITTLNDLATKTVESMQSSKRLETLSIIQKKIGYKFCIMDKKRILLKEGTLVTFSPYLGILIQIYVILLNDLLIICDEQNDQLRPKRPLDLIALTVSSDVNAFTGDPLASRIKFPMNPSKKIHNLIKPENGFSINVPCIQKVFRFYTRNLQEKNKWFSVFETVAEANKIETDIIRKNIGKSEPRFLPEKLFQYCFACKAEFSRLNRKHHCKACGYVFCKLCSQQQVYLDYGEPGKRYRVCNMCYDYMFKTFTSRLPTMDEIDQRIINQN